MNRFPLVSLLAALALLVGLGQPSSAAAAGNRLFFLHHSTGRNLVNQGGLRDQLATMKAADGSSFTFWDHDYNYVGLSNAAGELVSWTYEIPNDNTDPDGLHRLWTTANAARDSILANHDVIAFKSCFFPAADITSQDQVDQYKAWYLEIRDELDRHPDKVFLVMSFPPRHRLGTYPQQAAWGREFADWLGSAEFLAGHPNIRYFDLFDQFANPDDGSPTANMLRYEYELNHEVPDSHPNRLGNETVGPLFVAALVAAAEGRGLAPAPAPTPATLHVLGNQPNPFNPSTSIRFALDRTADVQVDIYDLAGRLVRSLGSRSLAAGEHGVHWDGRDDAGRAAVSGVYLYRVRAGHAAATGRMVLAK
jgi:hypothetical protein